MTGRLTGRVVVVAPDSDAVLALAAEGATVVLVGPATEDTGRLVAAVEDQANGRAAVYTGDTEGLAEFLDELFGPS